MSRKKRNIGVNKIKKNDSIFSELIRIEEKRGKRIHERFGEVITSGVDNPEILKILNDIKDYWRDYFRPTITSLSCKAVGGDTELAEDAGLMFTFVSSGIGIHDDILDKSSLKHLRQTILGKYGIESALLVGDLLIIKGWTIFHQMIRKTNKPINIANVIETYGKLCIEICEAESMENFYRNNLDIDLSLYKKILWMAMAEGEACTRIGAILGDGKPNQIETLAEFGRRIGLNSRFKDDIEDCLNIKGDLPNRIKNESIPLPILYAAKSSENKYYQIKKIIEKPQITPLDSMNLLKFCFETEAFEYVHKLAKQNKKKANNNLSKLEPSKSRELLLAMNERIYHHIVDLCI